MIAKCSYCGRGFDSHDGGARCPKCGKIACPGCEPKHFKTVDAFRASEQADGRPMVRVKDGGQKCLSCNCVVEV